MWSAKQEEQISRYEEVGELADLTFDDGSAYPLSALSTRTLLVTKRRRSGLRVITLDKVQRFLIGFPDLGGKAALWKARVTTLIDDQNRHILTIMTDPPFGYREFSMSLEMLEPRWPRE